MPDLSDRQIEVIDTLHRSDVGSKSDMAEELGIKETSARTHINRIRSKGYNLQYDASAHEWYLESLPDDAPDRVAQYAGGSSPPDTPHDTPGETDTESDANTNADADADADVDFEWANEPTPTDTNTDADVDVETADADTDGDTDTDATTESDDSDEPALPDLSDTPVDGTADPDASDLTGRERVILDELKTGATVSELTDRVDDRDTVVIQHLRDLRQSGWKVYVDQTAGHVAIEGDQTLRSSEHTGTRTRKANKWWERTHNALVKQYKQLSVPTVSPTAAPAREDWVCHMTDLHAGDVVRGYDGRVIHNTERLVPLIDYITQRSLACADKHGSEYDENVLTWGGDFVTNSGIYEGQFEDLDAWLDEQLSIMHQPLLRQIKAHAARFTSVHVVCQAGNHGEIRASGSSKQANADLILYKAVRNTVAALQDEGLLENVRFTIGRAEGPTPFYLRDGSIHGHLRHGQERKPQADTSARQKEWLSTILDSESFGSKFDVGWMGHHHVSGRLPWNGPPVFITGTPKPGGEYARALGALVGPNQPTVATCHGVSNDGITGIFPIDTRNFTE